MSRDMKARTVLADRVTSSIELATALGRADYSTCAATVVGYGYMGKEHVKALQALGVGQIEVCSRSEGPLEPLRGVRGITTIPGGFHKLQRKAGPEELAIVSTPTADLVPAAEHLLALGFKRLLIEKPVSLYSQRIDQLADAVEGKGADAVCANNRVAYPSVLETQYRTHHEGGITSCTYTFTELLDRIDPTKYPEEEMARWGIANSTHVMSLAHSLIGYPETWSCHRSGGLSWHPAGSVFTGSGISERQVPFSYHADWGSTGRWSVEVHTHVASYLLCPLEELKRRPSTFAAWEGVPVTTFAPDVKTGLAEQVAAMLDTGLRRRVPLVSVQEAAALTRFGESVFGYEVAETLQAGGRS